jgi:Bacteriocin-protection, YdeI or OmpD-Associated
MTFGDYVSFEGRIEPMVWGRATYTILRLPPDVAAQLGSAKRVEGEMNEHPVNLAPTRAPVLDDPFLWAGQSLLERIGAAPGDVVEVRLRPADPDLVVVDEDIEQALRAAGVIGQWAQLTPGKQRGLLYQVGSAKTPATRQKRIASLIAGLVQ